MSWRRDHERSQEKKRIALAKCCEREPPHPRPSGDHLHQERSIQKAREGARGVAHERSEGRGKEMTQDERSLRQTLCPAGGDEQRRKHFRHHSPRLQEEPGEHDKDQDRLRKEEVPQIVGSSSPPGECFSLEARTASERKRPRPGGEAQAEDGEDHRVHRNEGEGRAAGHAIPGAVELSHREKPEGGSGEHTEQKGENGKYQRPREAFLQELRDRSLEPKGEAEVSAGDTEKPGGVLDVPRAIEAVALFQLIDDALRNSRLEPELIEKRAGRPVDEQKRKKRRRHQQRNGRREAREDDATHAFPETELGRLSPAAGPGALPSRTSSAGSCRRGRRPRACGLAFELCPRTCSCPRP